jgi:hypothetical protein
VFGGHSLHQGVTELPSHLHSSSESSAPPPLWSSHRLHVARWPCGPTPCPLRLEQEAPRPRPPPSPSNNLHRTHSQQTRPPHPPPPQPHRASPTRPLHARPQAKSRASPGEIRARGRRRRVARPRGGAGLLTRRLLRTPCLKLYTPRLEWN